MTIALARLGPPAARLSDLFSITYAAASYAIEEKARYAASAGPLTGARSAITAIGRCRPPKRPAALADAATAALWLEDTTRERQRSKSSTRAMPLAGLAERWPHDFFFCPVALR